MTSVPPTVEARSEARRGHFPFLVEAQVERLFAVAPSGVTVADDAGRLGVGLGATLYVPGTQPELSVKLHAAARQGVVAAVVCLEDAVALSDLADAERNIAEQLGEEGPQWTDELPMLFLRPRSPEHLERFARTLTSAAVPIVGVSLPKFTAANAARWMDAVDVASELLATRLLAMPILEGSEVLFRESRIGELAALREILTPRARQVPVVRIGGTDLCGLLGLRRGPLQTIYDLAPLFACIGDIVNVFGRAGSPFVVSGPVWEYFHADPRLWMPPVRTGLRSQLLAEHLDGLLREIGADLANGLVGKTVIHPSHVRCVNAMLVPTYEEWRDASTVLSREGGVARSSFANKMNEHAPHRLWAERILQRASVFGVLAEGRSVVALLDS